MLVEDLKMGLAKSYRELQIWQSSIVLCKSIYELTSSFPKEEMYGISNQMRRCSVSIPSNIAEGFGRTNPNFLNYLKIARGSLYELDTQLVLTRELSLTNDNDTLNKLEIEIQELGKMINSFMKSLK